MKSMDDIKDAICRLSITELTELRPWFAEFSAENWDRQIKLDVAEGRLEVLGEKADRDFRELRCTPLYRPSSD